MAQKKMNVQDLKTIQEKMKKEKELGKNGFSARITVHMGTCGLASGAQKVMNVLLDEISKSGRSDISVTSSGCIGLCSQEPLITLERVNKEPVIYKQVDEQKMRQIFNGHLLDGEVQSDLALAYGKAVNEEPMSAGSGNGIPHVSQLPFFSLQQSWVLRNKGLIDPEKIDDYIWRDGYQGAAKALLEMAPGEIIS
jgi:(2Fe-2S) ferredoxin